MSYKALYRKYRPQTFNEIVAQDHIVLTLKNIIKSQKISHAYLFCGPRGTGKTSVALIFANEINKTSSGLLSADDLDIIEVDAASHNGVAEIRRLIGNSNYAPTNSKYKVYIIDEVHMLTKGAFNALLKTLEEPPKHLIFILATTEPHKIPTTILSRTQRFNFKRIADNLIINQLKMILDKEAIAYEYEAIKFVARIAQGGMRDALSIVDQAAAYGDNKISFVAISQVFGIISIQNQIKLLNLVFANETRNLLIVVENFFNNGVDIERLINSLIDIAKDFIIFTKTNDIKLCSILLLEDIKMLKISNPFAYQAITNFVELLNYIKFSETKKQLFEISLLKLSEFNQDAKKLQDKQKNLEANLKLLESDNEQNIDKKENILLYDQSQSKTKSSQNMTKTNHNQNEDVYNDNKQHNETQLQETSDINQNEENENKQQIFEVDNQPSQSNENASSESNVLNDNASDKSNEAKPLNKLDVDNEKNDFETNEANLEKQVNEHQEQENSDLNQNEENENKQQSFEVDNQISQSNENASLESNVLDDNASNQSNEAGPLHKLDADNEKNNLETNEAKLEEQEKEASDLNQNEENENKQQLFETDNQPSQSNENISSESNVLDDNASNQSNEARSSHKLDANNEKNDLETNETKLENQANEHIENQDSKLNETKLEKNKSNADEKDHNLEQSATNLAINNEHSDSSSWDMLELINYLQHANKEKIKKFKIAIADVINWIDKIDNKNYVTLIEKASFISGGEKFIMLSSRDESISSSLKEFAQKQDFINLMYEVLGEPVHIIVISKDEFKDLKVKWEVLTKEGQLPPKKPLQDVKIPTPEKTNAEKYGEDIFGDLFE